MFSKSELFVIFVIYGLLQISNGDNILGIFPHFGYSHFKIFGPILLGLAGRGHNITVITFISSTQNNTNYNELLLNGENTINVVDLKNFVPSRSLYTLFNEYIDLHNEGVRSCENLYESGHIYKVLQLHQQIHFEVVITEFFNSDCQLAVPYLMEVPVIGISSCALMPFFYDRILLPDTPSHVQSEFIGFSEPLSFKDRFVNYVQAKFLKYAYRYYTNGNDNAIVKKYLNLDNFDSYEIAKDLTNILLVNQHFTLTGNRPLTPQVIEIGGIHINDAAISASLPSEIYEFLENSDNSADLILISFGSMVRASTMDEKKLNGVISALKKAQLRVIWKWESDVLPIKDEKFLFVKWLPQLSLLCHPKIKYFWGHGGMLGTTEAFYCGKPMILTPIYGDQFLNAHAATNRQVGIILNFANINEDNLSNAIERIQLPKYTENSVRLSKLFQDRQTNALDTAIYWTEYVLRHKSVSSNILQAKAVNLNWFAYHSIDVILILLGCCAIILMIFYKCINFILLRSQSKCLKNKIKSN